MKKAMFFVVLTLFWGNCLANEIKVIGVSPAGDVTIDAGESITKPKGCWPFIEVMRYDIFKTVDNVEVFVARIIITQTFPTHSIGSITIRLDGSGIRPNPSEITKGMICRKTTTETLRAEKRVYKMQKKALKREYKLMKLKAKSGLYNSVDRASQDANNIKSMDLKESDWTQTESIKVEKK
ncbi:MAG: hypothetical protein NTW93_02475 [Phycisphaerae bacterium]|nr:hypothetical protein [Phycisphaerae bacterium]